MMPRRSYDFVYIPRIWPVFAVSSAVALLVWLLAVLTKRVAVLPMLAGIAFCIGVVAFLVFGLLKSRVLILAPPSLGLFLFRCGIGLWWGALALFLSSRYDI